MFQFQRTDVRFITQAALVTINAAGDLKSDLTTSFDRAEWKPANWVSDIPQGIEIKNDSTVLIYSDSILNREIIFKYIFVNSNGKWRFKTIEIK